MESANTDFKIWIEKYQHDQEVQNENIQQLTKDVAHLTATLQQLLDNQKGLFSRANRPTNWAAILTALAMGAGFVALTVAPMDREVERQHQFDLRQMEHMLQDAREKGEIENNLDWLIRMEDRYNERIHRERIEIVE